MVSPNTIVHLLSVDLEEDQKNQMDFASATAQYNYFTATDRVVRSYTSSDFTYQRKDDVLRVPAEFDELIKVNYVMYQNTQYSTKWFYAFVTRKEYVNANMTALYLKTDVFQTWQFEMELKDSFVAREHVADDTPWLHTLAEPINEPEYTYTSLYSLTYDSTPGNNNTPWVYAVYATPDDGNEDAIRPATNTGGTYHEVTNYTIGHMRSSGYLFGSQDYSIFKDLIYELTDKDYKISYTITIPASHVTGYLAVSFGSGALDPTTLYDFKIYGDAVTSETSYINLSAINTSTIGSYTVKNKKLNCYPYRYIQLTDDNTQSVDLKYEFLNPSTSSTWSQAFTIKKTAGSAPITICYPTSYNNKTLDYSKGITLSSYPPVPYAVDYYTQYAALHKASMGVERRKEANKLVQGLVNTGAGLITSNILSGGTNPLQTFNGLMSANDTMLDYQSYLAKYEDMKNHPPMVNNAPTGEPNFYINALRFRIYDVYPKLEYIKYIDSFFDKYGYNVSIVKKPQFTSRQKWNYLETKDINISAKTNTNIPQDDMQELKQIFNNGITIWHSNSATNTNWCNYNQSNPIVQQNP